MDQIEEIRSKIDLVAFISESLPLKKAGRNFKAICPFHTEKTPSFIVSPERQIWKCFGCQKSGDVFGFLMEMERMEFGEALRVLAKKAGVVLQTYRPSESEAEKDKLYQINHLAAEFFHYLLVNHQIGGRALNYILQRGITKESLENFKLGYIPPRWDEVQKFLVGKKGFAVEDLEKAGLVIPTSSVSQPTPPAGGHNPQQRYYDRFRDRLMFPLLDHRGNITGFAGRVLDPEIKEARLDSARQAKYVNTPETLIYHKSELLYPLQITKEEIKKANTAIVVEGELDAISSYQVGIKNVVAIKGSALTEPQARLLKRFAENLILSLDTDAAGDIASRRGIEIADQLGLNIKVAVLEKYKDPDEAAQKEPAYLKEQLAKAENIYDFYLDSAFKRFRGQTTEEKKKIGQEILPIFAKIEDEIVKNIYAKKLAEKLGVNEESIILQMEKSVLKPAFVREKESPVSPKSRREVLEEYFLALLFQSKKVESLLVEEEKSLFSSPPFLRLLKLLAEYFANSRQFSSQFFYKTLPAELRDLFDKLFLVDFGEKIEDEDWLIKETQKAKRQLQALAIKEELQATWGALRGAKEEDEDKLKEKMRLLTQKLANLEKTS